MDHRPGPDLQADEVTALAGEGDPSTALFTSFTRMAAQAAGKKTAIDLQARTGNEIQVTQSAEGLSSRMSFMQLVVICCVAFAGT